MSANDNSTVIQAILIDPFAMVMDSRGTPRLIEDPVRPVKIVLNNINDTRGILEQTYAHLSHEKHPVRLIDAVSLDRHGHTCYVDDEGLWAEHDHWFAIRGTHQPFKGRGLVVGTGRAGNTVSCRLTLDEVRDRVAILTDFYSIGAGLLRRNGDGSPVSRQSFRAHPLPAVRIFSDMMGV